MAGAFPHKRESQLTDKIPASAGMEKLAIMNKKRQPKPNGCLYLFSSIMKKLCAKYSILFHGFETVLETNQVPCQKI
jgi:hypothetical protein